MEANYTTAIASVIGLIVLLTGMTAFMLTRPSDLGPTSR
jgi:hypothetical protein